MLDPILSYWKISFQRS